MEGARRIPHQQKIEYAITNKRVLNIKTYKYLSIERDFIDGVITRYLDSLGLGWLYNELSYCIHELAANAHKANTKRVFFQTAGLDLNNPDDYREGMERFKAETFDNLDFYLEKQRQAGLFVLFQFKLKDDVLSIQIRNNTPSTSQEESRIADKLAIANQYENLADAFDESEDYSEGAGLGIVMLGLMLNTLGFGRDAISFSFTPEETVAGIELNLAADVNADSEAGELYA